jgi:hypothetical protein
MGNKARRRERETERERYLGREGEQHRSKRKLHGLILTVGLNQQRLQILTTLENFLRVSITQNNGDISVNQDLG